MKTLNTTLLATAFAFMATTAMAQDRVSVWFDGADVVKTSASTPETVQVAYSNTIYWNGGMNTIANSQNMGLKFESGDARRRNVQAWDMFSLTMRPGETAETVVALYLSRTGTALDGFLAALRNAGSTRQATEYDSLRHTLALGGYEASTTVSDLLAAGNGFLGSVRLFFWCDDEGQIQWNFTPMQNAFDLGWTGDCQKLMFSKGRATYLPMFSVRG